MQIKIYQPYIAHDIRNGFNVIEPHAFRIAGIEHSFVPETLFIHIFTVTYFGSKG